GTWLVFTEAASSARGIAHDSLKVSRHRPSGGWTDPVVVATSHVLASSGAVPGLGGLADGTRIIAYAAIAPKGDDLDLTAVRSNDAGASWRPMGILDRGIGLQHESRVSFATRKDGGLTAIWLTEVIGAIDRKRDTSVVFSSYEAGYFGARRP